MIQLTENTLFHNRYLLKKHLGSGGFSEVWLVEDTEVNNKKRALKIYTPGKGLDEHGVKIFRSEFEIVCDVNHTCLLRPAHYDVYGGSPYLLMPYCERGSASKLIDQISEEQAWRFLHDVASGLAHLHEQEPPIIHQDIKPDNILMDSSGRFLITDFGISAKARSTLRRSVGEPKSPMTVAYTPPERFEKNTVIKASDVWALGATIFELMEGDVPFFDMLGGKAQLDGAQIPDFTGKWSNELTHIVTQCLQKEPWDRPTAQQIVECTEAHFKGEKINLAARTDGASPVSPSPTSRQTQPQTQTPRTDGARRDGARPVSTDPTPSPPKKRQKIIIAIAAAVLAICVVAGIIYKGQQTKIAEEKKAQIEQERVEREKRIQEEQERIATEKAAADKAAADKAAADKAAADKAAADKAAAEKNKVEAKPGVLINGVRWATCNVDKPGAFAKNPEDAGMLYQWNRKTGWSSTDPMKNSNGGTTWDDSYPTGTTWEKANDPSPAGYRVPTKKELESLTDENYVTWKWTTKNGIKGYLLTDKASGNALFLPAAGYRNGSYGSLLNAGSNGYYWSSTPSTTGTYGAYGLYFYSGLFSVDDRYIKTLGFSVRCVAE